MKRSGNMTAGGQNCHRKKSHSVRALYVVLFCLSLAASLQSCTTGLPRWTINIQPACKDCGRSRDSLIDIQLSASSTADMQLVITNRAKEDVVLNLKDSELRLGPFLVEHWRCASYSDPFSPAAMHDSLTIHAGESSAICCQGLFEVPSNESDSVFEHVRQVDAKSYGGDSMVVRDISQELLAYKYSFNLAYHLATEKQDRHQTYHLSADSLHTTSYSTSTLSPQVGEVLATILIVIFKAMLESAE